MFNGFVRDRTVILYQKGGDTRHDDSILEVAIFEPIIRKKVFHRSFLPKIDGLVKSLQSRHSREACPRPDRGAGIQNWLILLDSRFSGNDDNGCFSTFYEFVKIDLSTRI